MDDIDMQLEAALRRPGAEVSDAGFSERVMAALPRRRFTRARLRRWTLCGAAAAGALVTLLVGAPLESAARMLLPDGGDNYLLVGALIVALVAVPMAWAFFSDESA
jgi:hypothetical protein